jgi:SAM-dependent methyltransferase
VCGRDRWKSLFERLGFQYLRCEDCGLVRTHPIPSPDEIASHYAKRSQSGNYQVLARFAEEYRVVYAGFLDFIRRHRPRPDGLRILDIGCFSGTFLDLAQTAGLVTYGVEYQPEAAALASAKHGGRVFCGRIEQYRPDTGGCFDIVTAFGLIEHLTEPNVVTQLASDVLKPGGLLVLQTPNTRSWLARVMGRTWPPYAPVEHVYYFSPHNLRLLLERHRLRFVEALPHWKRLPVEYVYRQLEFFGPEYHRILSHVVATLPARLLKLRLPFHGGEMLVAAEKV